VGDDRWGGDVEDEPDGEDEGRAVAGVVPLEQEPGEGRREQNPSEPALTATRQDDEADGEERVAGDELGRAAEGRGAAERVSRLAPSESYGYRPESESCREYCQPPCTRHARIVASLGRNDNPAYPLHSRARRLTR
jgi:hypothetical protein